jgi:predicted dinucleotide-binding enzyme
VFVASDDDTASTAVAALIERLGFAPVELGKMGEGGLLIQARAAPVANASSKIWPSRAERAAAVRG